MSKGNYKHGGCGTRLYRIWKNMRGRCNNPSGTRHKNYYDKGVKVCDEWNSYSSFESWARDNGYQEDLSIDRIDINGDYEPDNCRWVDEIVQQNNRSTNKFIEYNGENHTIREWERIKGLNKGTLWSRLNILKWDVERALNE